MFSIKLAGKLLVRHWNSALNAMCLSMDVVVEATLVDSFDDIISPNVLQISDSRPVTWNNYPQAIQ